MSARLPRSWTLLSLLLHAVAIVGFLHASHLVSEVTAPSSESDVVMIFTTHAPSLAGSLPMPPAAQPAEPARADEAPEPSTTPKRTEEPLPQPLAPESTPLPVVPASPPPAASVPEPETPPLPVPPLPPARPPQAARAAPPAVHDAGVVRPGRAPPDIAPTASTSPATRDPIIPPRPLAGMADNQPPLYPEMARRRREQGRVMLHVDVSADGAPVDWNVLQSSGHPALDAAAIAAVRQWRFVPASQGGRAIAASADVPIIFRLEE